MLQWRVVRMKRQRDKSLEATGFVLQIAQFQQMIDAVFIVLDVAVEHGRVGLQTDLVGELGGIQPLVSIDLVIANDVADAVGEDLSSPSGQRVHSRGLQLLQRLADGQLGALRQISDLDHSERFQMDLREALLQAGNQVEKILKWQIGMQAADNMEFRNRFAVAGSGSLESFFERHRVGARRVLLAAKGAEPACGHADIRRINVAIDVEVGLVAVHALAHGIRQPADRKDVRER